MSKPIGLGVLGAWIALAACGQVQLGSYGQDGIEVGGASSSNGGASIGGGRVPGGASIGGGRGPGGASTAGQSFGGSPSGEGPPPVGGVTAGASSVGSGGAAASRGGSSPVSEEPGLDAGPEADATPSIPQNVPPSCRPAPLGCGEGDSCCSTLPVPGGSIDLRISATSLDPRIPVTVSSFYLDKYEVTIGRFRAFLDNYDEWRNLDGEPQPGAASHPRIPGSGWQERYLEHLPASAAVFEERLLDCAGAPFSTWTAPSGTNQVPLNCVTWYEAAAFCAWDEGRLPTFAEWSYAAGGGAEDRTYPWGNEVPSRSHAMYGCTLGDFMTTCVLEDVLPVGSHPLGAGRYGQHDLAGSIAEWTLDAGSSFTAACTDCASLGDDPIHYWRGGSFGDRADDLRNESSFKGMDAMYRLFYVGLRCARDTGP